MAQLFKQMTIAGVGLIGGSLALVAKRDGLVGRIVGFGRTQANLDIAIERGIRVANDRRAGDSPGQGHQAGLGQSDQPQVAENASGMWAD